MHDHDKWPKTLTEAVDRLIAVWSEESRTKLLNTPRDKLVTHHFGLGTGIRNEFGLWSGNTFLLADCGHPEMHADTASSVIIQAAWNRLHGLPLEWARRLDYISERERLRELGPKNAYLELVKDLRREEFARDALRHFFDLSEEEVRKVVAKAKTS
jgi:hypothetical protein